MKNKNRTITDPDNLLIDVGRAYYSIKKGQELLKYQTGITFHGREEIKREVALAKKELKDATSQFTFCSSKLQQGYVSIHIIAPPIEPVEAINN